MSSNIITLYSAVWLLALVFLILGKHLREYRVDVLKHNLFMIRDELVDLAVSGFISFDDPVFEETRTLLSFLICFAHRITLLQVLVVFISKKNCDSVPRNPLERIVALPDGDLKDKLCGLYDRVVRILLRHVLMGAPILWIVLFIRVRGTGKRTKDKLGVFIEGIGINKLVTIAVEMVAIADKMKPSHSGLIKGN